jgi:hypothetical protein
LRSWVVEQSFDHPQNRSRFLKTSRKDPEASRLAC